MQLPQELMSQPQESDKSSDKKQRPRRHLSGGEELLRGFLMVQESCAEIGNMATPRRFMAFLHCYQQLYKLKKEGIENKQKHLQVRIMFHPVNALTMLLKRTFDINPQDVPVEYLESASFSVWTAVFQ